jgi:hypothetical protein
MTNLLSIFTLKPTLTRVKREWREVLSNTGLMSRKAAADTVRRLYTVSGLPAPEVKFFPSPLRALQRRAILCSVIDCRPQLYSLMDPYRCALFDLFEAQLDEDMQAHLATEFYCALHWLRAGTFVFNLDHGLALSGLSRDIVQSPRFLGGQDAYWLSAYDFAVQAGLLKVPADLKDWFDAYKAYAQTAGWLFPYRDAALVCDRPLDVFLDSNGRLHGAGGPALAWEDGFGICAWHGCIIPRWAVEERGKLNERTIAKESDPTVRAALFKIWAGGSV